MFGGLALVIGATLMVMTLLFWLREAMRDYDHLEPRQEQILPAVVHQGPPPGVHMPGPSIRPFLGALGTAALFAGLVIGGWVLDPRDRLPRLHAPRLAGRLHRRVPKVEEADRTGHLENIPARRFPARTLQVFAVLFTLVALFQLGILPPTSPATATGGAGVSGALRRAAVAGRRRARSR